MSLYGIIETMQWRIICLPRPGISYFLQVPVCPARVTSERDEVLQQTNGHNHPVDGVKAQATKAGQRGYPHSHDFYLTTIKHCVVSIDFS